LIQDLTNPSPDLGWDHRERASLASRASGELVMALALVHHLAIGNNVPLAQVAEFLARLAPKLIIEFVPKEDSQVQRLLRSREDIFDDYNVEGFEAAFGEVYETLEKRAVSDSKRTVYLFDRKEAR
jgi:ribosomal protein L11 methylase PrmA